jgi:hypothetical protein
MVMLTIEIKPNMLSFIMLGFIMLIVMVLIVMTLIVMMLIAITLSVILLIVAAPSEKLGEVLVKVLKIILRS